MAETGSTRTGARTQSVAALCTRRLRPPEPKFPNLSQMAARFDAIEEDDAQRQEQTIDEPLS